MAFPANPQNHFLQVLECNYRDIILGKDTNLSITYTSQLYLIEKSMFLLKEDDKIGFVPRYLLSFAREIGLCFAIKYAKQVNKYIKKEVNSADYRPIIDECISLYRSDKTGDLINVTYSEQFREINFLVFYNYLFKKNISFQQFLRETLLYNNNQKFVNEAYERLSSLFEHSRVAFLCEQNPEIFGIYDEQSKEEMYTRLYERSLHTETKNKVIEKFWNKIFKNYWVGVELLKKNIDELNDPTDVEIDNEIRLDNFTPSTINNLNEKFFDANDGFDKLNENKFFDASDDINNLNDLDDKIIEMKIKDAFHDHKEILKFFDDLNSTNDQKGKNIFDSDEFIELISSKKIKLLDNIKFNDKKQIYLYGTGHQLNNDFSKFLTNIFGKFDDGKIFLNIERTLLYSWHIYKIVFIIISELAKNVKNFETIENLKKPAIPGHLAMGTDR
uniref:Uncharacterized protein n=1 Tax=Meloidogyne floridensis TaxID=298350 RepID=A0A915NB81_9BILA